MASSPGDVSNVCQHQSTLYRCHFVEGVVFGFARRQRWAQAKSYWHTSRKCFCQPCLHAQIRNTRAEAEELSSAINTNLELLFFAEANNPFQNDRNVATVCILLQQFAPFPRQTAAGWRDFMAWRWREMKRWCFDFNSIPAGNHV